MQPPNAVLPEHAAPGAQPPAGNDAWIPTRKEAYHAWVNFVQHDEATSWNRFYNFLMFSSILILTWSTIYSQSGRLKSAAGVMALISVVGMSSGLVWCGLGYRGRKYLEFYLGGGAKLDENAAEECQVCKRSIDFGKQIHLWRLNLSFLGSRYVLT